MWLVVQLGDLTLERFDRSRLRRELAQQEADDPGVGAIPDGLGFRQRVQAAP
jgi:hypothetical protein